MLKPAETDLMALMRGAEPVVAEAAAQIDALSPLEIRDRAGEAEHAIVAASRD